MELLVGKLEGFGLKKFIKGHRHELCKNTVNQLKMATILTFDPDQTANIMAPPDNFSKCEKLYELIEKTTTPFNFLQALDETNNGHVIKFIEAVLMDSSSSGQNSASKWGIWFNIPEPTDSFCGREDFLVQLHDQLKPRDDAESEVTVLSQVKIVSGLGGIGKTQTARRYISQYFEFYNNFIWIDAETENSLRNSFFELADELKIPIKNPEGKSREIQEIVKEIYSKICEGGKSNLLVFDNAEDFQSCQQFLPILPHPKIKKPVILATSRDQDWISPTGKIQVLPLDKMTDNESLEFILKQLEIPESEIPEFKEESKEFIELIGGLPLALQQAVAYIKQEKELRGFLGQCLAPYKISDYVKEFKSSTKKLMSFPPVPGSSTTVFVTWNMTLEKILSLENGIVAIKILIKVSFLYADKIPLTFLRDLLVDVEERIYMRGLKLLEKYSLIKRNDSNFSISIHRQLQFVIPQIVESKNAVFIMVVNVLRRCSAVLLNIKLSECSDIFLNIHQVVTTSLDLISMSEIVVDFMAEFGDTLFKASRYSESLELFKKVYIKRHEVLGENHPMTLEAQIDMTRPLGELGRYEDALASYLDILKKQETHPHFGVDHPETITTKFKMADVLRLQRKYPEALDLFQQVLDQEVKIHGENHPSTLRAVHGICLIYSEVGEFPKALALYERIEKKQIEILGPHHGDVLMTKHNKAGVLYEMGKIEEAAKMFQEVYEKNKEILGENHLDTINALDSIALILELQGKLEEALNLYTKVYQIRKMNLGETHPQTIHVAIKIMRTVSKMESSSVLQDLPPRGGKRLGCLSCLCRIWSFLCKKNDKIVQ